MAGHSFVKRLASDRRAHHSSDITFVLKEKFSFFFQGYSGAIVGTLSAEIIPFIWDLQPSHVILDIGTNDLADRSHRDRAGAHNIIDFYQITAYSIKYFQIVQ